jgi:hypothetical protein
MEKYILSFLVETESDTDYRTIAIFDDLKTATKEFKKEVKVSPRYRQSDENDFREYLNESVILELYEGDDIDNLDHEETLMQEVIYSEGVIDRMNWKGNYPVNFYSRATFNGKELMHEMYFQGKKEMWGKKHKVPHSKLQDWYYR